MISACCTAGIFECLECSVANFSLVIVRCFFFSCVNIFYKKKNRYFQNLKWDAFFPLYLTEYCKNESLGFVAQFLQALKVTSNMLPYWGGRGTAGGSVLFVNLKIFPDRQWDRHPSHSPRLTNQGERKLFIRKYSFQHQWVVVFLVIVSCFFILFYFILQPQRVPDFIIM